jgi:Flp pilus assembly protein TadG
MKRILALRRSESGLSAVEFMLATVVFAIVVIGLTNTYISVRYAYTTARQLNEVYTVLSACPEVDRALEFNSLGATTNCYPNNSFPAENGYGATITYTPTLSVTTTSALPVSDPLRTIPDSKVVSIAVGLPPPNTNAPDLHLRMLITRNGVGQQ